MITGLKRALVLLTALCVVAADAVAIWFGVSVAWQAHIAGLAFGYLVFPQVLDRSGK